VFVGSGLLASGLTGCGDNAPSTSASATTSVTASATATVSTSVAGRASSAADLAGRIEVAVRRKRTARVRLEAEAGTTGPASGAVRFNASGPEFTMGLDAGEAPMTMVVVSKGLYLRPAAPVEGKDWLKLTATLHDLKGDDKFSAAFAAVMESVRSNLDLPRAAKVYAQATKLTVGGTETIDGVSTTRYTLELQPEALRNLLAPELRGNTPAASQKALEATVDLFVDAEWLPRRVVSRTMTAEKVLVETVDFSGWGGPVTVEAPPVADVADVADFPSTPEMQPGLGG
jgi:hypothetical protein